jgi:phenylpyruvate tautomerase PptA (4-oxalocrotonate tautomerase family)
MEPQSAESLVRQSRSGASILTVPHALIEVRRRYTAAEEVAIIDAVHAALVAGFRIPPQDKHLRLVVHEPHRFAVPPTLSDPESYTLVTIDCFTGRSLGAKRHLYAEIVERLAVLGIPRDHVSISLRESELENWGIRGGQAACDVDLGFDVRV